MDVLKRENVNVELIHRVRIHLPEGLAESLDIFKVERDSFGGLIYKKIKFFRVDQKGCRVTPDEISYGKIFIFECRHDDTFMVRVIKENKKGSFASFYVYNGDDELFCHTDKEPKAFKLDDSVY